MGEIVFMQDGHRAHCSRQNLEELHRIFREPLISLDSQVEWPMSFPDLNPLAFFYYGPVESTHLPKHIKEH